MSKRTQSKPATVAAPVSPVSTSALDVAQAKAPLATLSGDVALSVATAYAALAVETEGQSATFVARARLIAAAIGVPLTYGQWDKQMSPTLREAFKGTGLSDTRVTEYLTRFKVIALAFLTGDASLAPLAGESRDVYLRRVRPALEAFRYSDGVPMVAPSVTGKATSKRGRKPGAKASNAKPATVAAQAASAGTVADAEGGLDVKPALAAALILMRGNDQAAKRLVTILTEYRSEYDKWSLGIVADGAKADARATAKAVLASAKAPAKANGAAANA
jgi:hypothetical protein